jgi:hypothetical protein
MNSARPYLVALSDNACTVSASVCYALHLNDNMRVHRSYTPARPAYLNPKLLLTRK